MECAWNNKQMKFVPCMSLLLTFRVILATLYYLADGILTILKVAMYCNYLVMHSHLSTFHVDIYLQLKNDNLQVSIPIKT